ncbi:MAG: UDP-N-acetylmuramoyl-L-alanyl-D-glutamate--2,6-diaminopimelate ligase [Rickettsiales bacterium]|nr:UDP-N-acetylmuramoyl-L-alanyl-D-glutamate--2,6-diaminopimelate ligase [Rickettsiales bacterium]
MSEALVEEERSSMQSLIDLLTRASISHEVVGELPEEVSGVTMDSRKVEQGMAFVAIRGEKLDGTEYIEDAIAEGAIVIVQDRAASQQKIPTILVHNTRETLARMAAAFYHAQPEHLVAITGTNGKTSTAEFYRQLWKTRGQPAASLGTLGLRSDMSQLDASYPALNTSPDPVTLFTVLSDLKSAGVDHVALEASSHGLQQHRMDGAHLEAVAFTNLSRDHLDYHRDMDQYFAAKMRLFTSFRINSRKAVMCADDAWSEKVESVCRSQQLEVLSYGKAGNFAKIESVMALPRGLHVKGSIADVPFDCLLPLYGEFQLYNILAAASLAVVSGMSPQEAIEAMPNLINVDGRLECVAIHPEGAPMFIDYAHTPEALKSVLKTLRDHVQGRLIVVFGCGGDRDPGKRPLMGDVAEKFADEVIVTDDNPRTEDAATIRREIMVAVSNATEIADRGEAIRAAVSSLKEGDVLLVAGKGHETYQIVGEQTNHFDDAEEIKEALSSL